MAIGTDLEIIPPPSSVIAGADAERMPSLHTNARTDHELLSGAASSMPSPPPAPTYSLT
jgi:hypothetical protein